MNCWVFLKQAGVLLACLFLFSCGGEPFTYEPDHELKPGPGLFSGEDGEFTIVGKSGEEQESDEDEEKNGN